MSVGIRRFEREDEEALRRVMEAALEADRYPGVGAWDVEQEIVSIVGFVGSAAGAEVLEEDGVVCGYVSHRHEDLTVHPGHRRRGHGRLLLAAGLRQAATAGEKKLSLYVPSEGPGRHFATAMGMKHRSSLWRMDLLREVAVPPASFPDAVVARAFGDWLDLGKLVALINTTFADHPTPVAWTLDAIAHAHSQPDFDPDGVMLLCPPGAVDDPVGFVRAVLGPPEDADGQPVGEIRMVGVLDEWRGRGLGRELLRWGVARLRERDAGRVKLTVEARNVLALELYRRTGFEPVIEWPTWTLAVTARVPGPAK